MKFINYIEKIGGVDILGIFSLAVFFLFFLGMLVWVIKSKKNDFQEISQLPLDK